MIQFHVYPGGKKRIVTFSYDDGSSRDERLIALFNQYGVKGTFHLNGARYEGIDDAEAARLRALYAGHEVSCHTLQHGWAARMPLQSLTEELMRDRKMLEHIFGYPITGLSYPSGSYNEACLDALRACGIVYSRTVDSTKRFLLPDRFLTWHPTCHHKDALSLCDKFMESLDSQWTHPLFYIWGHSHEFCTEQDWGVMEEILKKLSGSDKIWYATNMEIYLYMQAQERLQISADETVFYNPSDITVFVERNKKEILEIPAGSTVRL